MNRTAYARWTGTLKEGAGIVSTQSEVLKELPYTFKMRFEDAPGTNPEELIAAAHSACYSMALSGALSGAGFTPDYIETTAAVSLETVDGKPTVSKSHLTTRVSAPGIENEQFQKIAAETKLGCPISRLLNAEITLEATLAT